MNKYQEQKDYAIGLLESNCHFTAPEVIEGIDKTLQKLINNYVKLEKALDKAVLHLSYYETLVNAMENDIKQLCDKYQTDNARSPRVEEQWKEWLLK